MSAAELRALIKCTHSRSYCVCMDINDELHYCPDCGKYGDGHGKWWKVKCDAARAKVKS